MIGDASMSYAWPMSFPTVESYLPLEGATEELAVKVTLKDTIRRFSLATIDHTELLATVRSLFGLSDQLALSLSWIDDEGDECRLDHEAELVEAARFAKQTNLLRLHASLTERAERIGLFSENDSNSNNSDSESEDDHGEGGAERDHTKGYEQYESASDSDDEPHSGIPTAYYTPLSSTATALIREMEDREMEEGLLPAGMSGSMLMMDDHHMMTAPWYRSVSCQSDNTHLHGPRTPVGVQASTITHEQSIQVNLINLTQPATYAPPTSRDTKHITVTKVTTAIQATRMTSDASTEVIPRTTYDMACQYDPPSPAIASTSTQCETTTTSRVDKETQHFNTVCIDARSGPDAIMRTTQRRYKNVDFSHSIRIPTITEEAGDADEATDHDSDGDQPRSPYPREASDEESDGLLEEENEEGDEHETEETASPAEFVMV
ncbi:hypothetical protein DFJ77DRAFT_454694 [Powellomyces hirtus]|nr:hypothetical protein DFJ77DRAFT_454694 [Powellomyces hirtus]